MSERNPYNWAGDRPARPVRRTALVSRLFRHLTSGKPAHIIGARGMGKTVFLRQLEEEIRREGQRPLLIENRPEDYTISGLKKMLAERLKKEALSRNVSQKLVKDIRAGYQLPDLMLAHRATLDAGQRLVLIFDELDSYAVRPGIGRDFFDSLEAVRKSNADQLSIMFAGSLGLVLLRSDLGSSFFSRQERALLEPFSREEAAQLAEPFAHDGRALSEDVLDALYLTSGGIPLLLTYGLGELWGLKDPTASDVTSAFDRFRSGEGLRYLRSVRDAIFNPDISSLPGEVWRAIYLSGHIARSTIDSLRATSAASTTIDTRDIFDMLRSSGLVTMPDPDGWNDDPVRVEPIPSILRFAFPEKEVGQRGTIAGQLVLDLAATLSEIHAMSLNYFTRDGEPYPEALFATNIALSLNGRGWKCELEPLSGAGYADLKVRHPRFVDAEAVIEVKHWPANDYQQIHDQVTSYLTRGVKAFACIMIAHHKKGGWRDEYAHACLEGRVASYTWREEEAPLGGYFDVPDARGPVAHFLLQLARR